ncbi:MAG: hypothetical protein QM786_04085 [Breznakibacter sp.]
MRKIYLALICFIFMFGHVSWSQDSQPQLSPAKLPGGFLGGGIVTNELGLFGISLEQHITSRFAFYGNAGVGTWGWKLGGGIQCYLDEPCYRSAISIGYSHASGMAGMETDMEVEPYGDEETVDLNLKSTGSINMVYSYNIRVGRMNKFVINAGYAIPLENEPYEIKTPGVELNDQSKEVMRIMQPGGIVLGVKFMFALR